MHDPTTAERFVRPSKRKGNYNLQLCRFFANIFVTLRVVRNITLHTCIYIYTYARTCKCIQLKGHMCIYIYVRKFICAYIYMYVKTCVLRIFEISFKFLQYTLQVLFFYPAPNIWLMSSCFVILYWGCPLPLHPSILCGFVSFFESIFDVSFMFLLKANLVALVVVMKLANVFLVKGVYPAVCPFVNSQLYS